MCPTSSLVCALLAAVLCLQAVPYSDQAPDYTFLNDATSAPIVSYYDYIIVGGGTAGCPLAATLSQNHSGGTCLNAGFYSRATSDDVENAGWDQRLVNESYHWVEKLVAFEPSVIEWQSAVKDGLLEAGVTPNNGFTYDHIIGTKVGGTIFDYDGHRHTAADLLKYANPKGLTVLLNAVVQIVLFSTHRKPNPAATGVVFTDAYGVEHRAYLNKEPKSEIIISAGALGSPQLLMLSGVGPAAHLKSHGILVVLDQPLVGQGMSDNPLNLVYIPSPVDVETSLVQVVGITEYGSYIEAPSGFNLPQINFGMYEPQSGKLFALKPKGRTPEDMEKHFQGMRPLGGLNRGGFIGEKVTGPLSAGHLELRNKNPEDNPKVTFNYFENPIDLERCTEGVRIISRVIESKAFSKFTYFNFSVQALINQTLSTANLRTQDATESASLEQFCKDTVTTLWHYHGGCQVEKVVDRDYKVLGVDSLRVVDGSTFRFSPGTNPQATVMMLGRYVGVKILNERLKPTDASAGSTTCSGH